MFQKERSVLLRSSASALTNNLSVLFGDNEDSLPRRLAVVHRCNVDIVSLAENGGQQARQVSCRDIGRGINNLVLQAKLCQIGTTSVLVVASQQGIQIFDTDGILLMFWHALNSKEAGLTETYSCGIAAVADRKICVGTHLGSILVFNVPHEDVGISLEDTLWGHEHPISHLNSNGNLMSSADEFGSICVWNFENNCISKKTVIIGTGIPATSIALWNSLLLAGFTSGHLRLYDNDTGCMLAEVAAHARAISAVDIAPLSGLALSASEDTFVHVWKLDDKEDFCIQHEFSESIQDAQLCGACFLNPRGTSFCVASYDSEELVCYTMP